MRTTIMWACLLCALTGCGEQSTGPTPAERTVEELTRQLGNERRRHERREALHQVEINAMQEDQEGTTIIWISLALSVVILTLLLARERRARRVLERLVRLLLSRMGCSRDPPGNQIKQEES